MARKCLIEKANGDPKYKTRKYNRCKLCGRRRAYYRKFQICRICFRMLSLKGEIPGVKKASW
ncbi:type Z 30S ribosomal protein S14 [Candidatus Kuenenia sp.]|uniref:type Z 30S ribosomal protein S14 n=1 Tax=Candidatus Kuenenia sp. TaxID=2499824 RepID=UPI0032203772